jgi:hypothetical protein
LGRPRADLSAEAVEATLLRGDETLEVVGESAYQEALWMIVGGRSREPIRHPVRARLLPEPTNDHDENAIRIAIDGHTVGYLSREDAAAYKPGLLALMERSAGGQVALNGQIVGGGQRGDRIGFLGVFLDHDPGDFGVSSRHASTGHIDLGWSAAIDQDDVDDSYDLSWAGGLSGDDAIVTDQLERLLEAERDPVDRHFMFNFLAERLYRLRDDDPGALPKFDSICEQHHSEMRAIRPELLRLFNGLPRVPMYRQAAIRHQKAKNWEQALIWAERGVAFYGNDAIRHENLDDLQNREAHARAKLAAPAKRPSLQGRSHSSTTAVLGAATGVLVCTTCGSTFEREVKRGRKPKQCSSCAAGIPSSASATGPSTS